MGMANSQPLLETIHNLRESAAHDSRRIPEAVEGSKEGPCAGGKTHLVGYLVEQPCVGSGQQADPSGK